MPMNENEKTTSKTRGLLIHKAAAYDIGVWLMTFGRERTLRQAILAPARLQVGESVLDVGCGSGSLAIEAKRQVGKSGAVHGIDGSPEMIARAVKKSHNTGFEIAFENAPAQSLPFMDNCFDVVLNTLMFHHLPRSSREQCAHEMRRVARAGGRVLVVDFVKSTHREPSGLLGHLRHHGGVDPNEIVAHLESAGLKIIERGNVDCLGLKFVLAEVPATAYRD